MRSWPAFYLWAFIYQQFRLAQAMPMLIETAGLSGAILLIIGAATGMAGA